MLILLNASLLLNLNFNNFWANLADDKLVVYML